MRSGGTPAESSRTFARMPVHPTARESARRTAHTRQPPDRAASARSLYSINDAITSVTAAVTANMTVNMLCHVASSMPILRMRSR